MCLFFFFFQAEDGIRDTSVTGVQTCALPIFKFAAQLARDVVEGELSGELEPAGIDRAEIPRPVVRSEERRVGKEWRPRRRTSYCTQKRGATAGGGRGK